MNRTTSFSTLEQHILFSLSSNQYCTQSQMRYNYKISEKSLSDKIKNLNQKLYYFNYEITSSKQGHNLSLIGDEIISINELINLNSNTVLFSIVLTIITNETLNFSYVHSEYFYTYAQVKSFITMFWDLNIASIKTLNEKNKALLFSECFAIDILAYNIDSYIEILNNLLRFHDKKMQFFTSNAKQITQNFLNKYNFEYSDQSYYRLYGLILYYFIRRETTKPFSFHSAYDSIIPDFVDLNVLESLVLANFPFSNSFFNYFEIKNAIQYRKVCSIANDQDFIVAQNELKVLDVIFNSNFPIVLNTYTTYNKGYNYLCANSFYFREVLYREFQVEKSIYVDYLFTKVLSKILINIIERETYSFNKKIKKLSPVEFKHKLRSEITFPVGSMFYYTLNKSDYFDYHLYKNTDISTSLHNNYLLEVNYQELPQLRQLNLDALFLHNQIISDESGDIILVSQNETQYTNFIILKLKMNF
ncbi:MAG: hypothetical protein ACRCUP_02365, partial [Mycoplasmatales bacterium]